MTNFINASEVGLKDKASETNPDEKPQCDIAKINDFISLFNVIINAFKNTSKSMFTINPSVVDGFLKLNDFEFNVLELRAKDTGWCLLKICDERGLLMHYSLYKSTMLEPAKKVGWLKRISNFLINIFT